MKPIEDKPARSLLTAEQYDDCLNEAIKNMREYNRFSESSIPRVIKGVEYLRHILRKHLSEIKMKAEDCSSTQMEDSIESFLLGGIASAVDSCLGEVDSFKESCIEDIEAISLEDVALYVK